MDVVHWVKDWKAESPPESYTKTLFSSVSFPANKSPAVYWHLAFKSSVGPQRIKLRLLLPKSSGGRVNDLFSKTVVVNFASIFASQFVSPSG